MFSHEDVRRVRDHDRRIYRRWVIFMVFYQIIVAVPVRLALDVAVRHAGHPEWQPYIPGVLVLIVGALWAVGIWATFRRRY